MDCNAIRPEDIEVAGEKGEMPTLEEAQAELKKARDALSAANAESASRRKKIEELEKAQAEKEKASLTDLQKIQVDFAAFKAEAEARDAVARVEKIRHAVIEAARAAGFADPLDAFRLLDLSDVKVEGDAGAVSGFEAGLKKLTEDKPYLLGAPSGPPRGALGTPIRSHLRVDPTKIPEKVPVKIRV